MRGRRRERGSSLLRALVCLFVFGGFFCNRPPTFFYRPFLVSSDVSGVSRQGAQAHQFTVGHLICSFIYFGAFQEWRSMVLSFLNFRFSRKASGVQTSTLVSSHFLHIFPFLFRSLAHSVLHSGLHSWSIMSESARVHLGIICGLSTMDRLQTEYSQLLCLY